MCPSLKQARKRSSVAEPHENTRRDDPGSIPGSFPKTFRRRVTVDTTALLSSFPTQGANVSKFYSIEVNNEDSGRVYACADGDIEVVSYVGRKAIADIKDVTTDVRLSLIEVDEIGQGAEETRSIAKLTADAGTVSYVLKAKLSAERKLVKAATDVLTGDVSASVDAFLDNPDSGALLTR